MNTIKKLLGKRIKKLRTAKKLTQEDLADILGTDQKHISNIECGVTFPSQFLNEIAKALNVSLPELFEFEHLKYDAKYKKNYIVNSLETITESNLDILFKMTKSMK